MSRGNVRTELWLVDLVHAAGALEAAERETPRLTGSDRARIEQIGDAVVRRERLAAQVALRLLLGRFAGARADGLEIARDRGGKPRVMNRALDFSLAHTQGHALVGITEARCIGVDLERRRHVLLNARHRASLLAAAQGLGGGGSMGVGSDDAGLLKAWVRLEAFAKARGTGLAALFADAGMRGQRDSACSPGEMEVRARELAARSGIAVADLLPGDDLFAAVALSKPAAVPAVRGFPHSGVELAELLADGKSNERGPG
jgi:4'-phosphopantetheinyl transferase